jgi:hypothetical protein
MVFQVHHKLLTFGLGTALPLAILVLLANLIFVVVLSIQQMRHTYTPSMALIVGDLPVYANQIIFQESRNTVICTSSYNNNLLFLRQEDPNRNNIIGDEDDATTTSSVCFWTPCTLNGLSASDYDLKQSICPISYNGCYQNPDCVAAVPNSTSSTHENHSDPVTSTVYTETSAPPNEIINSPELVDVCSTTPQGLGHETTCQGVNSITYYTCPSAGTVIGSALGYSALVQMAALVVLVLVYCLVRSLFTGKCYSLQDLQESMAVREATLEQASSKRRQQESQPQPQHVVHHV